MSEYHLEPIKLEDTELIYFMRSISKSKVLKPTDRIKNQTFIRRFLENKEGGYLKFCNSKEIVGYYRWQNNDEKVTIGSWITNPSSGFKEKILFDLEFKLFVFNETVTDYLFFEVERNNSTVWRHHERLGAELIREDQVERHYRLSRTVFKYKYNEKINRFNPRTI